MAEQHFAIVFKKDFEPGDHWDVKAPEDDADRKQHWRAGDLYSIGTVVAAKLPFHLEAIPLEAPPESGDTWDREARCYRKWHENKTFVRESIAHHEAMLAQHQAEIDRLTPHR